MRGQTSLEYLLIASGVVVLAVVVGYYVLSAASSAVPAPPPAQPSPLISVSPPSPSVGEPVSITCSLDDARQVRLYMDGNLVRACPGDTCTYRTSFSTPGKHNAVCEAVLQDGSRWTFKYFSISLGAAPPPSDSPPTVSILSPANGSTFDAPASVDVTLSASDDNALSSVALDCGNGQSTTWTPDSNTFSATYTCTYSSSGTYTITATATDSASQQDIDTARISVRQGSPPPPGPPSPPPGKPQPT